MIAHVHDRLPRRMTRGGSRRENKGDDLASARADIDGGREVQKTKRDKTLYAQHDAGVKDLDCRLLTLLPETRQLTHSMTSALELAVNRS